MKNHILFAFLLFSLFCNAQIKGTITDEKGNPLPFVSVFEENTYRGTTSNEQGRYQLQVKDIGKNKIVFQDEVPQPEPYLLRTGNPVGQPFGFIFDRFYNDSDPRNANLPDHLFNLKPGDMVYKDLNGDNIIDQNDQRAIGFPTYPLYNAGINCGFQLKNFDLSMSWAGAANTSRLLAETYRQAFGQTLDRSLLQYMADGRWTPETADRATFPRMTLTGGANNNRNSDFWLRDASYLRLKNLEAGYNFKGNFLKKFGVSNLRTFINGANLITITKLDITDPESRTGDDSEYPLTKIYNFGLRVTFL